jgi:hypothetical protein
VLGVGRCRDWGATKLTSQSHELPAFGKRIDFLSIRNEYFNRRRVASPGLGSDRGPQLARRPAAIDHQRRAGDHRGGWRRQKDYRSRDIRRFTDVSEWNAGQQIAAKFLI